MPRITVTVDEETEGWLISQQAETGRTVAAAARFAIENAMRADQCRERAGVTSSRPAPSPPTTDRQAAAVAGSEGGDMGWLLDALRPQSALIRIGIRKKKA